jgi:hypothetical protein
MINLLKKIFSPFCWASSHQKKQERAKSQISIIMEILKEDGVIDTEFAEQNNLPRLTKTIHDLRKRKGWKIKTQFRFKDNKRIVVYKLESTPMTQHPIGI